MARRLLALASIVEGLTVVPLALGGSADTTRPSLFVDGASDQQRSTL
jgi:hypothetical protein